MLDLTESLQDSPQNLYSILSEIVTDLTEIQMLYRVVTVECLHNTYPPLQMSSQKTHGNPTCSSQNHHILTQNPCIIQTDSYQ